MVDVGGTNPSAGKWGTSRYRGVSGTVIVILLLLHCCPVIEELMERSLLLLLRGGRNGSVCVGTERSEVLMMNSHVELRLK